MSRTSAKQPSEAMRLWQSATPIQNARLKFGPREIAERLEKNADVTGLGEMAKQVSSLAGKKMAGIEVFAQALHASLPAYGDKWASFHALNKFFISEFRSGRLRCFGFEVPRSLSSNPVEIAPEHWAAYPDWDKGEYKAHGLHIIELRVLSGATIEQPTYELDHALLGRPSISTYVTAAFEGLRAAGKIDTSCSAKSHYPMIRVWIAANFQQAGIDAEKLSDEGIRFHFSPLFKALRESSKQ